MSFQFTVRGTVCTSSDLSRAGLKIRIFECASGVLNTLLGQTFTDERGHYSFSYAKENSKPVFNMFLEISDRNKVLKRSDIIFNVLPDEVKNFIITSDKERVLRHISKKVEMPEREKTPV